MMKLKSAKVLSALNFESFNVATRGNRRGRPGELEDHPFDLVLLDVSLPDRNGIELLREIHRRDPELSDRTDHRLRID